MPDVAGFEAWCRENFPNKRFFHAGGSQSEGTRHRIYKCTLHENCDRQVQLRPNPVNGFSILLTGAHRAEKKEKKRGMPLDIKDALLKLLEEFGTKFNNREYLERLEQQDAFRDREDFPTEKQVKNVGTMHVLNADSSRSRRGGSERSTALRCKQVTILTLIALHFQSEHSQSPTWRNGALSVW